MAEDRTKALEQQLVQAQQRASEIQATASNQKVQWEKTYAQLEHERDQVS